MGLKLTYVFNVVTLHWPTEQAATAVRLLVCTQKGLGSNINCNAPPKRIEVCRNFIPSPRKMSDTSPIRPQPLPIQPFSNHYSPNFVPFLPLGGRT
jgi:hypothetical protein